ncbi:MAG: HNH endonuclease signature motif containing protein, partial [Candidatus Latescibacterota bacterium]
PDGKRCNSQHNLEYDHYPVPYARGGPSTVNNLRLLCAKHNRHAAIKTYGERAIEKHYIKEKRAEYEVIGALTPLKICPQQLYAAGKSHRRVASGERSRVQPLVSGLAIDAYNVKRCPGGASRAPSIGSSNVYLLQDSNYAGLVGGYMPKRPAQ